MLQEKSFNGSPKNNQKDGMTAIQIKQYQFVGGVLTKTDPNQPMHLKSAYSTANIQEGYMSGSGKPNSSRLGYTSSGRTLGQIMILKHQTPSSLMVSAYHLNHPQHNTKNRSTKRNTAQYYSTAPTSGLISPKNINRRYIKD